MNLGGAKFAVKFFSNCVGVADLTIIINLKTNKICAKETPKLDIKN